MRLPEGVFDRPRQEKLIDIDEWAIIRIDTGNGRYPYNTHYKIRNRTFDEAIAPYLHGDWEDFDRYFRLDQKRIIHVKDKHCDSPSIYTSAEHRGDPKLPNITVVPNLTTSESSGMPRPFRVFGTTMGHYHPSQPGDDRVQEVYEFQSYGLLAIDREAGEVELWIARDGDKVAVPSACHMTLYNLGDIDYPLITLNFSNPERNPSDKSLIRRWGPILLAYYDDFEVTFTLNRTYINNPKHTAGVRLSTPIVESHERQIRIARGARLDLGRLLYEQLTRNPAVIGQFARLGIHIKQASPDAILEPLRSGDRGSRLYFSLPLVQAVQRGTDVYRYFFPTAEAARPSPPLPHLSGRASSGTDFNDSPQSDEPRALNRPLVITVEGVGDWVEQTYRPLFDKKVQLEGRKLSVFYADDTRWKERPAWAAPRKSDLRPWEAYLDKADPGDFAKYQKLRPDVVFVVTPDFTHSTIARNWLNKSPMVFLEKPFDSQVRNVDDLRRNLRHPNRTEILGLDHYQFYALPLDKLKDRILEHLGGALTKVEFYLTEDRPIELGREMSLQYGMTLDLLPHLAAMLTYFGDISTIDEITVIEAGQYQPLLARGRERSSGGRLKERDISERYHSETYSRVQFTFLDNSGNGFHVPCVATVGKGFSREVKYFEVSGISENAIRVDLKPKPADDEGTGYPWDSVFFLQGPEPSVFPNAHTRQVQDPYNEKHKLKLLYDPNDETYFCEALQRERYAKLLDDLLDSTNNAVISTLSLTEGQDIVRALDRTWWAIQAMRPYWLNFELGKQSPFESVSRRVPPGRGELQQEAEKKRARSSLILPASAPAAASAAGGEPQPHIAPVSVRTRGPLLGLQMTLGQDQQLAGLVRTLRSQVKDLPLTVLIHGWGSASARDFLHALSRWLQRVDAVWLIPAQREFVESSVNLEDATSGATSTIEGTVQLNLSLNSDRHIYYNLVGDLVFFPGLESSERKRVARFNQRARAVVVDGRNPFSHDLIRNGNEAHLPICDWSGEQSLSQCERVEALHATVEEPATDEVDIEDVGRMLKELIEYLTEKYDRRLEFRAILLKFLDTHPGQPSWGEDLIRLADRYEWPSWAVECLPHLFVLLGHTVDGRQSALIWHYMLDCIPTSYGCKITDELCGGQIFEIHMTEQASAFAHVVARFFEENLRLNPRPSERSLLLAVNKSMMDVEYWIYQHAPEVTEEFEDKRRKFIEKMQGTRS
jgi:hypothetical protein